VSRTFASAGAMAWNTGSRAAAARALKRFTGSLERRSADVPPARKARHRCLPVPGPSLVVGLSGPSTGEVDPRDP
jgi:hypothetical protein